MGQDLRYNPDIPKKSKPTEADKADPSFPDRVVTFFSSGFTPAQKRGEGNDSIIGSKVSITKMGPPMFIVICKIAYQGKNYLVGKNYSGPEAASFNPVPEYGKYLDPNVLFYGKIIQLPDPELVYKIHEEEVWAPVPSGFSSQSPNVGTVDFPYAGIAKPPAQRASIDITTYATNPDVKAAALRDGKKRQTIKIFDTAVKAKEWVENVILPINELDKKSSDDIESIPVTVREGNWEIFPASEASFETGTTRSGFWASTLTAEELYNNYKIFEFDTSSKVFPPPYSYTVKGIVDKIEGHCAFDAKEYISTFYRHITGDISEREELNLSICSNEIASDILLNLFTIAFALAGAAGAPAAPVVVLGSIAIQGIALLQLAVYQFQKNDKTSCAITLARLLLLFIPLVKMHWVFDIISNILQFIADAIGAGSIDTGWVKPIFYKLGLTDDDTLSKLPEVIDIDNINDLITSLPAALEESRIYRY